MNFPFFRQKLWLAVCTLLISGNVRAGEILIAGIYQGKNLFIQNPFSPDNKTYCASEVYVNDEKTMSNIKLGAFEIDLSGLEIDDPVTIRITHKDGCAPKLINPQAIRPSGNFQIADVRASGNTISWSSSGETTAFAYYIESLVNGNWIVLRKINAKGQAKTPYAVTIAEPDAASKYRIKAQNSDTHQMFYSRVFSQIAEAAVIEMDTVEQKPVTFVPKSPKTHLTLSRESEYEILDAGKKTIAKGKGVVVSIARLKTGTYYLKTGNQPPQKFVKQKFVKR